MGRSELAGREQHTLLQGRHCQALFVLLFVPFAAAGEPCPNFTSLRQPYFGDTHVHTSYSQDANWRMGSSRTTPADAYRFARGERISLPPYDGNGKSPRSLTIDRPLDFAIVTDHAENMNMVRICSDTAYEGFGSWSCHKNAVLIEGMRWLGDWLPGAGPLCGDNSQECSAATSSVWRDTIAAAQEHLVECDFSTFIAYEWSGLQDGANMHRNVIFGNDKVPDAPISALDEPAVEGLWLRLDEHCSNARTGCEAITIPHNSNLSAGQMFSPLMGNGEVMTSDVARRRVRYERLAEIYQHKGDSECYFGADFAADELCSFEKLPYSSFLGKYFELLRKPPANDSRYMREALREGFRLKQTLGVNPFTPGFIGSTDTHIGAPGAVAENRYQGNHGAQKIIGDGSQPQLPDRVEQSPGGLAVLYAEQNSRDALFAAMQRREAYGTSGTRIGMRFFGGWDYPADLCQSPNFVARGYTDGVPMGGVLAERGKAVAPVFAVWAQQDSGTATFPGFPLQRIQIIKGWVDDQGNSRETVYDIAGKADTGAGVDLNTCQPRGTGFQQLCEVWTDPDFDPTLDSYYYTRVVENPSCRWQQHICASNKVSCDDPDTVPPEFAGCCDTTVPKTIQERAWSSPIWYRDS